MLGLLILVALCRSPVWAAALWTLGNSPGLAQNNALNAVVYGNSLFVAVGDTGTLLTSPNGITWTAPNYGGTTSALRGIAYGAGKYVAVGDNGWTVTSSDGVHWSSTSSGATVNNLRGITFATGQFVAVGDSGTIISSADGSTWSLTGGGVIDAMNDLAAITYGNGQFVTVGNVAGEAFFSTDGTSWTQTGAGLNDYLTGAAYGNGLYVAVDSRNGGIYTSADANTWKPQGAAGSLHALTYGNGVFLASGDNGALFISQGTGFWTRLASLPSLSMTNLYGVAYGSGTFVAVGDNGTSISSTSIGMSLVTPGINWVMAGYAPGPIDTGNDLYAATVGGGQFVAAGYDTTNVLSATGTFWSSGGVGLESQYNFDGLAYGNGLFVMVDADGGGISTSADGSQWTLRTKLNTNLRGVASHGGRFVAVGDIQTVNGVVAISSSGMTWTTVNSGVPVNLNAITASDQHWEFVAVGDSGRIITSADHGTNWTAQFSGTSGSINGITYGAGHFVAVGDSGLLLTSSDGQIWSQPSAANYLGTPNPLRAVAFGNGWYVAVGDNGWTVISHDAVHWISMSSATATNLHAIAYSGGVFVVVGDGGTIMESVAPKLGPLTLHPAKVAQIPVSGGAGQTCQIQISTNLVNWTALTNIAFSDDGMGMGTAVFTNSATASQRFYRGMAVPSPVAP